MKDKCSQCKNKSKKTGIMKMICIECKHYYASRFKKRKTK